MREVSPEFMQSIFSRETEIATICLLTIDHPDLVDSIRLTNDTLDTISRGDTYFAYPFKITLPDDAENAQSKCTITIDNVGRQLIDIFRNAVGANPEVLIELVKSTDWDTVEVSISGYIITEVSFDALSIQCTLSFDARINEPCPAGRFSPTFFPNVH